jgi:phenylacetic acid degradation operon negative regulatory protein
MAAVTVGDGPPIAVTGLRPQSMLLTLFGDYASDEGQLVSSAGVIDVLTSAGVGAHATRATLSRMTARGLLHRVAAGRSAYFGVTEFGRRTVLQGRERAQGADVVDRRWKGGWTFVGFSLPDDSARERHDLRSRLVWAGFGLVQPGLWAAPREVDVVALLDDLSVLPYVTTFHGEPTGPTSAQQLVASAFDLETIAERYRGFHDRWSPATEAVAAGGSEPLVTRLVLNGDWLVVLRDDPRLPVSLLPEDWPAIAARDLHRTLEAALRRPAEREARHRLGLTTADESAG